jgi:YD repeat-containing protein
MNDPQMNDILARLNSVGTKPADPNNKSSSAGDPAMHDILSRFHSVSGKYQVNEGLGAEQRKVGQLAQDFAPKNISVVKHGDRHPMQGKLVGEDTDGGVDTLTMGVPLFIRMLEYAREEARTDADLHHVTKKMLDMGGTVTMDDYDEIMTSVGGEESEMDEAVGDKLTDVEYGSATATATPTVGGYHQRRDLETGSYTDYTDRGPISTQTTYDKSGQMTSQHAQARVGDQTMARSRFYPKKKVGEDYVGGREAPQDLVKSLSKSYRDFVKEVEQQSAAQPDRELRSKKEKPRKFGNILGEE